MPTLTPNHRAEALAEKGAKPKGLVEENYCKLLEGKPAPEEVVYASDIYENTYKCEVVEAFLLAGASAELIFTTLRVPTAVTEIYSQLFFDKAVFKDELDIEAYAQTYPEDTPELKWGKELKIAAITLGVDYLVYRFGRGDKEVDMTGSLKSIILNSFMLAKATKLNPLDSNVSREARQWAATTIKALETYVKVKPAVENTDNEFTIALENIERSTNEAKSGISKDDIVH